MPMSPAPAGVPSPRPSSSPRRRSRARGLARGRGRLAACDEAGGTVVTRAGMVRGTWGAAVLAAVAAAPTAGPRAGQLVEWLRWPDGRVTVERLLA